MQDFHDHFNLHRFGGNEQQLVAGRQTFHGQLERHCTWLSEADASARTLHPKALRSSGNAYRFHRGLDVQVEDLIFNGHSAAHAVGWQGDSERRSTSPRARDATTAACRANTSWNP